MGNFASGSDPRLHVPAQTNGVDFASMVLKRERANPRFAFLLPWNPLHPVYRARAAAALTPAQTAQLFPKHSAHAEQTPAAEDPAALPNHKSKAIASPEHAQQLASAVEAGNAVEHGATGSTPSEVPGLGPSAAQQQADLDAFSAAVAELDDDDTVAPGTEAPVAANDGTDSAAEGEIARATEEPGTEAAATSPCPDGVEKVNSAEGVAQTGIGASGVAASTIAGLAANPPVVKGLRVRRAWDQRPEDLQPLAGT